MVPLHNPELFELPLSHDHVRLVYGGNDYFNLLLQLIKQARSAIHLQVYIFEDDETGRLVADALAEAAGRGVKVFLLVDGYASQNLPDEFIEELSASGVAFRLFEPLLKSKRFYFGRRLHHKVFVADGNNALVGGINISDRYRGATGTPPWFDMAIYLNGKTARELEEVCCTLWNSHKGLKKRMHAIPAVHSNTPAASFAMRDIKVSRNDWVKKKVQVWNSYADLLAGAEKEITIVCSYFLPGWKFRRFLAAATEKGVCVKVVVAGPSDVMIAKHAERFLYRWLLAHNVRIYEYQKSILHAKIAIADSKKMTIGSYNINNISAYASVELNLDIQNVLFVTAVGRQIEMLIETDCTEITHQQYMNHNNGIKRIWQRCCYEIIKILMYLFTFYFRQDEGY